MPSWVTNHPERFVGSIGAIIVIICQELLTQGVVTRSTSVNLLHFISIATPLIVAELILLLRAES